MFEDAHQHRALWQSFSKERLGRYLDACADDQVKALDLYKRNLQLSSHFYIPLQCLEITLRNTLSVAMSEGLVVAGFYQGLCQLGQTLMIGFRPRRQSLVKPLFRKALSLPN